MRHMVVYGSAGSGPTYFEADDLDGAVRMVEHLRNSEHVMDVRIYALEEVQIEFKAYYRVEVTAPAPQLAAVQPEPVAEPAWGGEPPWAEPSTEQPAEPYNEPVGQPVEPAPVLASVSASAADDAAGMEQEYTAPTPVLPTQASGRFGLFSRG